MKAFLMAICVAALLAVGSDFIFGGPLTGNPDPILDYGSDAVYAGPNVRLD